MVSDGFRDKESDNGIDSMNNNIRATPDGNTEADVVQ
jgi:hypothetical protein